MNKKKLIEVALPLEAINKAASHEKSVRQGHPSSLHLWWARRPLAAARAVIFAQMVDDPSAHPDIFPTEKKQEKERQRLFRIIEDLVKWENTTNEEVLVRARDAIWESWQRTCAEQADHPQAKSLFDRNILPAFHDPFGGGGALPLEGQRLGLSSYATDLNPIAVLINKAMIEIPPRFAGISSVNPEQRNSSDLAGRAAHGVHGLAEDIRYYGNWMRDQAVKRIGQLYPKVEITKEMVLERPDLKKYVGKKLGVISWLWARTVYSPNPAFANVAVPLVSSFVVSSKAGKEAYVDTVFEGTSYSFKVKVGKPSNIDSIKNGTSAGKWGGFRCLMSDVPMTYDYIRNEGQSHRIGVRLMGVVVEGTRERVYLSPTVEMEDVANSAQPFWKPEQDINYHPRDIKTQIYGLNQYSDLFTPRQLVALATFSDLIDEVRLSAKKDAVEAGFIDDGIGLEVGGNGATAYAEAISVYLAFALSKQADLGNSLCRWEPVAQCPRQLFGRQAIPMIWDFAEGNPLGDSSGSWVVFVDGIAKAFEKSFEFSKSSFPGRATQADAGQQEVSLNKVVSTDPPYYDNIGYADLSDFFYVWQRRTLRSVFPQLFSTLAVPKAEELVATPYRHGSKEKAETFFLDGMTQAMHRIAEQAHPAFPVSIYYAFKQSESSGSEGTASTGWETFLEAVLAAGFSITGTWPMRTENSSRMMGQGYNSLASSIVLICRKRDSLAQTATRREFVSELKAELPRALLHLQEGNIAPVDLAQAAIGPGMAVYTRYSQVIDAEGKPIKVRAALALINETLDESLAEQEGDFDADSRWALTWFDQAGFSDGDFGVAEQLSKSKNTAVNGLVDAGIILSRSGKVRLLKPSELPADWDPTTDDRLTVWEMVHHLIRVLESGGESAAAQIVSKLGSKAEAARELCYRLYMLCERRKRSGEAMAYNALVQSWPEITRLARETPRAVTPGTNDLFDQE